MPLHIRTHLRSIAMQADYGRRIRRWSLWFAVIPVLVFFLIVQRKLVSGLTSGAVKG